MANALPPQSFLQPFIPILWVERMVSWHVQSTEPEQQSTSRMLDKRLWWTLHSNGCLHIPFWELLWQLPMEGVGPHMPVWNVCPSFLEYYSWNKTMWRYFFRKHTWPSVRESSVFTCSYGNQACFIGKGRWFSEKMSVLWNSKHLPDILLPT